MAEVTINGVLHDWESVTVVGPQGTFIGIMEISWKASQEKVQRYGKGGVSRGVGRKNYTPEASFVVDEDEWLRLTAALGGTYNRAKFTIVIAVAPPDSIPVVTELVDCRINSVEGATKQGEETMTKSIGLTLSMIRRNGVADYD